MLNILRARLPPLTPSLGEAHHHHSIPVGRFRGWSYGLPPSATEHPKDLNITMPTLNFLLLPYSKHFRKNISVCRLNFEWGQRLRLWRQRSVDVLQRRASLNREVIWCLHTMRSQDHSQRTTSGASNEPRRGERRGTQQRTLHPTLQGCCFQ